MMDVGGGPRASTPAASSASPGVVDPAHGRAASHERAADPATASAPPPDHLAAALPSDLPSDLPVDLPANVADLREIVRQAAAAGTALRLVGAGGWLRAGRPVGAARYVALSGLAGIVEHVPGDLTMTAGAGTPLADLQAAALAEGQFVPLDPWGDDRGTLGATLATATAGPLSGAFGLPRDVVLGVTAVTGTGELIRAGGRVVKNVAGFDLVRLMVGAWGTLGALTEATVRLRAIPEGDETLAIPMPAREPLEASLARLRGMAAHPLAAELLHPALARAIGVDVGEAGAVLVVRIAGNEAAIAAQRTALATLGDPIPAPEGCWRRLRAADGADGAALRLSAPPADLAACWRAAGALVDRASAASEGGAPATAHASLARGVVRVCLPPLPDALLRDLMGDSPPAGLTRRFERLPAGLWPILAPSAVADRLSRGVRQAFDPRAILNPGILGADHAADHADDDGRRPDADPAPALTTGLA